MRIINGTVSSPFVFQSSSQNKNKLDGGKDTIDFGICWKSGSLSEKLSLSQVNINADSNKDSNNNQTDLINSSDKKLSDLYCSYTADGGIAVVTTERVTLKNGGKNCDISYMYSAPDNFPPYEPNNPAPSDLEINIENYVNLSWNGGDPDLEDIVKYDIYFGITSPPIMFDQNVTSTYYNIGLVDYSTEYYWKIVAHDNHNLSSAGPIWLFTTENSPPSANAGGPYSGYVNNKVTFDGSGSFDLDGNITGYQWDFNGDGIYETDWLTNSTTTFTYSEKGNYNVIIQVKDNNDAKGIDTTTARIMDNNGNGGSGGGGGSPVPTNTNPIADASKGEPYEGTVGEDILFDGSKSYDPDEDNITYAWDFGDDTSGTGEITIHVYSDPGTYTIILTVEDESGAIDKYQTQAVVIAKHNNPPSKPTIDGIIAGTIDTEYDYTFLSIDVDNDTINYSIIWGDQTSSITESEFLSSGTEFIVKHSWKTAGKFMITVIASDNKTVSETSTFNVYIDSMDVGDIGYVMDNDGDGTYDIFYNETSKKETNLGIMKANYLIDDDGDGKWDYTFNDTVGLKTYIEKEEETSGFEIVLLLIGLLIVYWKRKKQF